MSPTQLDAPRTPVFNGALRSVLASVRSSRHPKFPDTQIDGVQVQLAARLTRTQVVNLANQLMLANPTFFDGLLPVSPDREVRAPSKLDVIKRWVEPELGIDVAIKDCGTWEVGAFQNGYFTTAPEESRYATFFRHYRSEVKSGEIKEMLYCLVELRAFGTFEANGNHYILMEHLTPQASLVIPDPKIDKLRSQARDSLYRNIKFVQKKYSISPPQYHAHHLWLGHTDQLNPENGKFIVALPQDRM